LQIRKILPCEAAKMLERKDVPYGQDFALPYDVDTSGCQDFGGIRCDCNLHVKGKNIAHRDRVDPRYDLLGHWEKDCGIPVGPLIVLGALGFLAWIVSSSSRNQNAPLN
jgi:hypothetical protein